MHFNDFFEMFLIVFVKLREQKWEGSHLSWRELNNYFAIITSPLLQMTYLYLTNVIASQQSDKM